MSRLSLEQGSRLVRLARRAVESYLGKGEAAGGREDEVMREKRGVFVTIRTYPTEELRGCIGFPLPILPLHEATVKAALSAALNDPRFRPVEKDELDSLTFEVSVLTVPEEVKYEKPTELPKLIKVGEDGLIIETRYGSGLLLPQVPVEEGWDAEDFLTHLCLKAGLPPTYWLEAKPKILRFSAQVFKELRPRGDVVEVELGSAACGYT